MFADVPSKVSELKAFHFDRDGASANDKCIEFRKSEHPRTHLRLA